MLPDGVLHRPSSLTTMAWVSRCGRRPMIVVGVSHYQLPINVIQHPKVERERTVQFARSRESSSSVFHMSIAPARPPTMVTDHVGRGPPPFCVMVGGVFDGQPVSVFPCPLLRIMEGFIARNEVTSLWRWGQRWTLSQARNLFHGIRNIRLAWLFGKDGTNVLESLLTH
ncbi:hypothetical protein VTN31DRAFT_1324 [Thermomyces dupontii]|uniref:uncharacterized protein n=1 Tax=Talaromyces thermophilus TaxID=28565 RepID=UPI003742BF05